MPEEPDWFYLKTGKKIEDLRRSVPTAEKLVERRLKQYKSSYPLRSVGVSADGEILLSEEERIDHVHILGTTGEGKSKFIEHLIRGDILAGNGVCLLDPTDRGETCANILRWCAREGFTKICLIDPHTIHSLNRLTCLQPFHRQKSYKNASIANVMDTVRVLFQTKDASETPRIQKYLSAMLSALWSAGMTLHEALYFTDYASPLYRARRDFILEQCESLDRARITIEDVFRNYTRWQQYFSSTINRLEPFFDSTLDLMYGSDAGVDFMKMITEGWVVLVNLYSGLGFEPLHTRLLGTTIINEIIFALDRLKNNGWKGVYYLYIDEAGRYANRNLADLLAYKRKSGLRVTIAHQYFKQFEDITVLDAVKNLTKIKVMFNTPNPSDRLEMIKALGYGGDIPHELATYANKDLAKQEAVVKIGKANPVRVKIPNVADVPMKQAAVDDFVLKLLTHPWNKSPQEVRAQFESRFHDTTRTQRTDPKAAWPRAQVNGRPSGKTRVPDKRNDAGKWKDVS
jgi:hypothetical protein